MPRIAYDDFGDTDLSRVYLAGRLAEAKRVEKVLDENAIDYAVQVEPYRVSFIIVEFGEYKGAAFYVLSDQADFCRGVLADAGLSIGILEKHEPQE